LQERYNQLKEKCQPFLWALEHFPGLVRVFVDKAKELFAVKEAQKRKAREEVERQHKAECEARKQKNRGQGRER
jgi:hypothetical protein